MLIWPDVSVVRFFYQNDLYLNQGKNFKVVEFGCGSGSNLRPFIEAGWEAIGVDCIDQESEFFSVTSSNFGAKFIKHNLEDGLPLEIQNMKFDVVIMPQILYYLEPQSRLGLLKWTNLHLNNGGCWFLTERLFDDYRAIKSGIKIDSGGTDRKYIEFNETNEKGLTLSFWQESQLLLQLSEIFDTPIEKLTKLHSNFENISKGFVINNSDLIVWGQK